MSNPKIRVPRAVGETSATAEQRRSITRRRGVPHEDNFNGRASDTFEKVGQDEWWAQGGGGGRGGGCFGGDFGDDAATLARAAQWRRENPDLAVRQAEFFHSLWDDPGGAVAKEELLALGLSPDYRHECGICDRDYMLRRGCPCCRD